MQLRKLIIILICLVSINTYAENINLSKIAYIESRNNPLAYNKYSGARGIYQITPICLKDYNNYHKVKYNLDDLFIPKINRIIASWYLEIRIPQMLKHYKKEVNIDNILWAYNAGIGKVIKEIKPEETKNYIIKYYNLK